MRLAACIAAVAVAATACTGGDDGPGEPADPAAAATAICRAIDTDAISGDSLVEIEEAVDRYATEGIAPSQLWHELDVTCGEEVDALFAGGEPEPDPTPPPSPEPEPAPEPDPEPEAEEDAPRSGARTIEIGEATTCTMPWAEWSCTLQEVRVASAENLNRNLPDDEHADVIVQMRFEGELTWLEDGFTSSLDEVLSAEFQGGDGLVYDGWLSVTCNIYASDCLPGDPVPIQEANRTGVVQDGWYGLPIPNEALQGGHIEVEGVAYRWSD